MAKLLCSYLCLFDTIIELHAMDEKHSMTFSSKSESGFICNKIPCLIHDIKFVNVVETFITLN